MCMAKLLGLLCVALWLISSRKIKALNQLGFVFQNCSLFEKFNVGTPLKCFVISNVFNRVKNLDYITLSEPISKFTSSNVAIGL